MKKETKKSNIFSWKIDDADLENQVENYNTLKITKSYRGISILIFLIVFSIQAILVFSGILGELYPIEDLLYGLILYIPVLFFTYKGHKWAIIALIIFWTADAVFSLFTGGGIGTIFWWAIVTPYLYKTLVVENKRKKLEKNSSKDDVKFCSDCGTAINEDTKFCSKCGKNILKIK